MSQYFFVYIKDTSDQECQVLHCDPGYCFGSSCFKCNDGYYNQELNCHKCPDYCVTCFGSSQCEKCISGRHGSVCQFHCSLGCKNSTCSKDSGFCTEGCKHGYIMMSGNCQSCPRNCVGCAAIVACTECKEGFWGDVCQYNCHGCNTFGCGQKTNCTYGCIDGFYAHIIGENQYECTECPMKCQKCTGPDSCSACKTGYWGNNCTYLCNVNCKGLSCQKSDGFCVQGCKNGYYSETCSETCPLGCATCQNEDNCTTCVKGKYGNMCDQPCSENCFRDICFRNNGTCKTGCKVGYTGDKCFTGMSIFCVIVVQYYM